MVSSRMRGTEGAAGAQVQVVVSRLREEVGDRLGLVGGLEGSARVWASGVYDYLSG